MSDLLRVLRKRGLREAASEQNIAVAEKVLMRELPQDYRTFLSISNGYDGFVGEGYLSLWRAEDLSAFNSGYRVTEFVPDVTLIGSDGGGTAYGIDWSHRTPSFMAIPFIVMTRDDIRPLGCNFDQFIWLVATGQAW